MIQAGVVFPSIDYAVHPAFRTLTQGGGNGRDALGEWIQKADAALDELHAAGEFVSPDELQPQFANRVLPSLDAMQSHCDEHLPESSLIRKSAFDALQEARTELLKELLYFNEKKRYRESSRRVGSSRSVVENLRTDGLSLHTIPAANIRAMFDDLGEYRERLLEMSERNGGTNCGLALPLSGRYWKEAAAFLHREGVLQGCSDFRREDLEPAYCALVLSHDGERWYKSCYEDVGLPTARTVYMHNDKDYDVMKILIYLSEVDEKRGPFCFVKGSHHWKRSRTQSFLFKALDSASNINLAPKEPVRTVYYRKAFKHPAFREQFLMLPPSLRGSSHFGDDVLDDSELSRWLLERETSVLSEMANCMAFVGADGIHRGGCVQEGRRWAFQIGLRKRPPFPARVERSARAAVGFARSKARGAMRRLIGEKGLATLRSAAQRTTGK